MTELEKKQEVMRKHDSMGHAQRTFINEDGVEAYQLWRQIMLELRFFERSLRQTRTPPQPGTPVADEIEEYNKGMNYYDGKPPVHSKSPIRSTRR